METNTTTEVIPANLVQYRAFLDMMLASALNGEKLTMDKAFKIIDAVNLATSEAYTRGYECARETYKSY
jgi:hypothetical protein